MEAKNRTTDPMHRPEDVTAHANGHRLRIYGQRHSTAIRRLAAALPRDAPVDRVTHAIEDDKAATAWLTQDTDESWTAYWLRADGYEVADVWVAENGAVAVDFSKVDA